MSEKEAKAVKLLDTKLDKKVIKTLTVCTVIMLIAILIHDGDHIRQAYNWGYTIPLSLWALNLGVLNFSYFDLIKGVTYDGVFYQGVDWLSWVLLFHIPMFCLPCSAICFKEYRKLKNAAK